MSKAQAIQHPRFVTPVCTLDWPWLTVPDTFKGSTDYKTGAIFNLLEDGVQEFVGMVEGLSDAAYEKGLAEAQAKFDAEVLPKAQATHAALAARAAAAKKVVPAFKPPAFEAPKKNAPFQDRGDGTVMLRAKLRAEGKNRATGEVFQQRPNIVDKDRQPWDLSVEIFKGSTAKLYLEAVEYNSPTTGAGVHFRLKAVQILELQGKKPHDPFAAAAGAAPEEDEIPF